MSRRPYALQEDVFEPCWLIVGITIASVALAYGCRRQPPPSTASPSPGSSARQASRLAADNVRTLTIGGLRE
jgi:hypothetical protein